MEENSIEDDIKNAEHFIDSIKTDKEYKEENGWHGYYNKEIVELTRILEHILSDYKRVLKENEDLKNEIMEKDLEIIGKEEYTKASMKEIIAQYYTANEDCILKSKVKDKIEKEIKHHEKNILDIENITMLRSKTAKEEAEIEFNKYAIVVLNKILQELIEESEEK